MPNLIGYDETADPGWIIVHRDDGESRGVADPTGEFRKQISMGATSLVPSAAPPISSAPAPEPAFVPPPQPDANAIFTPPSPAPVTTPGPEATPVAPPPPAVPTAPIAAAPVAAGTPAPADAFAPSGGMQLAGQGRQVSGLAQEDRAEVKGAFDASQQAAKEASEEDLQATNAQLKAQWDRLTDQQRAELAKQQVLKEKNDKFELRLKEQNAKNLEVTNRPIDGARAFDGDAGWYAFMAAMGEAISDFGRALAGQPSRGNPAEVIDRIMKNSINQQTELKQEQLKSGRITVNQYEAERERIRLEQAGSMKQLLDIQEKMASTEQEKLGIGAAKKHADAIIADAAAKNALALARQEVNSEDYARPKPGPAVVMLNPETAEENAVLSANGVDQETYQKYGKERIATGADETLATNAAARQTIEKLAQGQDVPGVGKIDQWFDSWTRDPDGTAVQQVLGMTKTNFIKEVSGAAVSNEERALLGKIVEGRATKDDIMRGLDMLDRPAKAKLATLNNSFPGADRAYRTIGVMRENRTQLSEEQQRRKNLQTNKSEDGPRQSESPEAYKRRVAREERETRAAEPRPKSDEDKVKNLLGVK